MHSTTLELENLYYVICKSIDANTDAKTFGTYLKKITKGTRYFYLPILEKFLRVMFRFANGLVFGDSSYF